MSKPYLIVVAGCNGSGKSTFSQDYVKDIVPFDYDKRFMEIYSSMSDSELRSEICKNQTSKEFESSIDRAFSSKENFCYETNFDAHPISWAQKAKELGYRIELHFYCLDSLGLAKQRVDCRIRNKGHFVNDKVIFHKWKEGYKNLNIHYSLFDYILFIDNSSDKRPVQNLFALIKDESESFKIKKYSNKIPLYAERRCPDIYKNFLKNY